MTQGASPVFLARSQSTWFAAFQKANKHSPLCSVFSILSLLRPPRLLSAPPSSLCASLTCYQSLAVIIAHLLLGTTPQHRPLSKGFQLPQILSKGSQHAFQNKVQTRIKQVSSSHHTCWQ